MSAPAIPPKYRVFLVDDHPIVRQGLTLLINQEADLVVSGEAEEAGAAREALVRSRPDILVLDLSLPGVDGFELLKSIRSADPTLPILVLSMHDESVYAERALRSGANGYIMKQEATEKVLVAIRKILRNEVYVSERLTSDMLQQMVAGPARGRPSPIEKLTDRELKVFRMIGEGMGTRQIAELLDLSVKTVESHQAHIKEKLALKGARELVQHAIEWTLAEKLG